MTATYEIAMAAGRDAGNKLMRELGLSQWNTECWNRACDVFASLVNSRAVEL